MTNPPDFGGREIEEGIQEDLGVPLAERPSAGYEDRDTARRSDHEAHAAGQVCGLCGAVITPGQDVRRRPDGAWVHEVCP